MGKPKPLPRMMLARWRRRSRRQVAIHPLILAAKIDRRSFVSMAAVCFALSPSLIFFE
jgi:hypothetical protein